MPDAGLDRADEPPSTTGPPEITTRPGRFVEQLQGGLAGEDRRAEVGHDHDPRAAVCTADRRGDPVGVRAERAVGRATHRLERDVIPCHLAGELDDALREAAGMGYDDDPDERRGGPGLGQRWLILCEVREPADGVRRLVRVRPSARPSRRCG